MLDLGADFGYYATKYVTRRDSRGTFSLTRDSFPSFIAPYVESALSLNGDLDTIIEYGDQRYIVGEGAVRQSRRSRKEFADWTESLDWRVLFCTALSKLTSASSAEASIVIGLPLNDYARKKDELRDHAQQSWSFTSEHGKQAIAITRATVIPQAWGAILCRLLDTSGNIQDPSLARSRQAVIDIGGHTVNYLAVDGLSDLPDESRATDRGAWTIMRSVRELYDREYPELNRLSDHHIMRHVIDRGTWYGAKWIDLLPVVKPLIDSIAQEIVDTAHNYFGQGAMTFQKVHVIGGGAHLFGKRLINSFPHAYVPDLPEFVNAEGFYRYACYIRRKTSA